MRSLLKFASRKTNGKIQGNPMCAEPAAMFAFQPLPPFEHNERAFNQEENNYLNVLLGHLGRPEKTSIPLPMKGIAASWSRTVPSTEMFTAMQRLRRASGNLPT
jgi:hypothetical protein